MKRIDLVFKDDDGCTYATPVVIGEGLEIKRLYRKMVDNWDKCKSNIAPKYTNDPVVNRENVYGLITEYEPGLLYDRFSVINADTIVRLIASAEEVIL